jgi:hypothetical protein
VKKRRLSIEYPAQQEEPCMVLPRRSSRTRNIFREGAKAQSLEGGVFTTKHTKDTKFGKEGDLISSLTFVIFVPFVVSHCSRTWRPFDVAQGMLCGRFCLLRRFCIDKVWARG